MSNPHGRKPRDPDPSSIDAGPLSFSAALKQEAIRDIRSPWARRARIGLYLALASFATLGLTYAGHAWFGAPVSESAGVPVVVPVAVGDEPLRAPVDTDP